MDTSFITVLDWALGWWLGGKEPGLGYIRQNVEAVEVVTRWVAFAALALAVVAVAVTLSVRRRGADLADAVIGLGRFLLVLSGGWLALAAAWTASDALGAWIIGGHADRSAYVDAVSEALAQADPALARTLAVVGTAAVLGFIAVVVARLMLTVLVAVGLPVVAALSLRRRVASLRWGGACLVAVMAFRPLAAVVYRMSHGLVLGSKDPVLVLLVVCLTFLLSAALLPAMVRIASVGA
ncbi:MAG: hypothetical protein V9G10_13870 [Candidatus Nanopelagicales bacterium]